MKVVVKEKYVINEQEIPIVPDYILSILEKEQQQQTGERGQSLDKENVTSILKLWIKECELYKQKQATRHAEALTPTFEEWYKETYLSKQPPGLTMTLLDFGKKK